MRASSSSSSSSSSPSKILVGIPLDKHESNELLSWAIRVLACPCDTIIAIHVLVNDDDNDEQQPQNKNKKKKRRRMQDRVRRAKAHVISALADHAWSCSSREIHLEARVGFSSSVEAGLVHESSSISADYLVLPGFRTSKTWHEMIKYCFEHAAEGCSVISIGKSQQPNLDSDLLKEVHQSSLEWLRNPSEEDHGKENLTRRQKYDSPRTVLEVESPSPSPSSSSSSFSYSSSSSSLLLSSSNSRRKITMSPYKTIASFFTSPFRRRSSNKPKLALQQQHQHQQQSLLNCFTYEEIARATSDFHPGNLVGVGGYSEVYRGDLPDGTAIAVKRIAKDDRKEKEFLTELGIVSHICHPNTAALVGCCIENGLYLVFGFSQNGNLASALHGKAEEVLAWETRYRIALGVARGLHYLHKSCKHRIIHRDIKASNILLGPDYEPQITDFGLAKWLPSKWTHHDVIPIEGTFGYLAPEYFMHGIIDEKTDVYSFGVLLLEIVSGRRPVDSSMQSLLLWAKPLMESGSVDELVDPNLEGKFEEEQVYRVVLTASYCVRQSATWRPSMSEVLELLTAGPEGCEVGRSWSIPKFTSDELDDFSMVYGYDVPVEIDLEEEEEDYL